MNIVIVYVQEVLQVERGAVDAQDLLDLLDHQSVRLGLLDRLDPQARLDLLDRLDPQDQQGLLDPMRTFTP